MVDTRSVGRVAMVVGSLLLVVGSLPITGAASGVTLTVDAPESAAPGEEVTVTVTADAETPLYGVQYTLSFDSAVLSVQRVEQGSFFSDEGDSLLLAKRVDASAGRIEYGETRQGSDSGITGSGTVTRVRFVVDTDPSTDEVRFTLSDVKASDPDGQPLETTTQTATLTIHSSDGTGTDAGQATATGTDQSTVAPWREKLTTTLKEELEKSDVVPVIVVVADSADLDPVTDAIERTGGDEVEPLPSIHSIAAVVDHETLAEVAKRDDVERVRYDSRVSVNTTSETNESGTTTESETAVSPTTSSESAGTTTTSSEPAGATTATGSVDTTTSTNVDGFGVVSSVLGLLTLLAYVGRKTWDR